MNARHDFPAIAAARSAPLDHATLAAGLALVAARSPTGRAQARLDRADRPDGLAALVAGVGRAPASFHPAPDGEGGVHPHWSTARQPFALQHQPVTPRVADPDPGQRERP